MKRILFGDKKNSAHSLVLTDLRSSPADFSLFPSTNMQLLLFTPIDTQILHNAMFVGNRWMVVEWSGCFCDDSFVTDHSNPRRSATHQLEHVLLIRVLDCLVFHFTSACMTRKGQGKAKNYEITLLSPTNSKIKSFLTFSVQHLAFSLKA